MFKVLVQGSSERVKALREAARYAQRWIDFGDDGFDEEEGQSIMCIRLMDVPLDKEPFLADRRFGVRITTRHAKEISRYADIPEELYLLLCSLLGLTQWRALQENPDLEPEDFLHRTDGNCLFARRGDGKLFPCLLERPHICGGCLSFYHALGADSELLALQETLRYASSTRDQWALSVPHQSM